MGTERIANVRARLAAAASATKPSISDQELTAYRAAKVGYQRSIQTDDPLDDFDDGFVSGLDGINVMSFEDDLIEKVLPAKSLVAIIGNSNVGKTFLATTMLKSVAAGLPFNEHRVEKGGALYVGSEGSAKFARRRAALYRGMDKEEADKLGQDPNHYRVEDDDDTFLTSFDFPMGKEPENACAHLYRLACKFRARRGAFPVVIVVDHMLALQPKDATGYDWQNVLSSELKNLRDVVGCTVVVLIHENKQGGFFGSVTQRAAWDDSLHVLEDVKESRLGGKKVQKPTGLRFITSDKVRDGEKHNEADTFTLVSRLLGVTPSGAKVTSAVLKFGKAVRVDPSLAVNDDDTDEGPEAVQRDPFKVKKDGSSEARALQLMAALREHRKDTRPDDPPSLARYSWSELRDILDAFRTTRCVGPNGKPLAPLAPKGTKSKTAFNETIKFAIKQEWLTDETDGYAEAEGGVFRPD